MRKISILSIKMLSITPVFISHTREILIKWAFVGSFVCDFNSRVMDRCEVDGAVSTLEVILQHSSQKCKNRALCPVYCVSISYLRHFRLQN